MDESERRAAGLEMRRKVLGHAYVERAIARTPGAHRGVPGSADALCVGRDLVAARDSTCGRGASSSSARSSRSDGGRSFACTRTPPSSRVGFSAGDLKEIVLQQAIYCGVPAANKAFEVLREVVDAIPSSKPT